MLNPETESVAPPGLSKKPTFESKEPTKVSAALD
jgi:hypothetical protein